jgi:glycine/D-amino acid oxidase-like deaminating enzyme
LTWGDFKLVGKGPLLGGASGKDARQHVTVIGLGVVSIVSAIEAVREGHRVTVIEALGFEPEALA